VDVALHLGDDLGEVADASEQLLALRLAGGSETSQYACALGDVEEASPLLEEAGRKPRGE
jgi:hypothetical protein